MRRFGKLMPAAVLIKRGVSAMPLRIERVSRKRCPGHNTRLNATVHNVSFVRVGIFCDAYVIAFVCRLCLLVLQARRAWHGGSGLAVSFCWVGPVFVDVRSGVLKVTLHESERSGNVRLCSPVNTKCDCAVAELGTFNRGVYTGVAMPKIIASCLARHRYSPSWHAAAYQHFHYRSLSVTRKWYS